MSTYDITFYYLLFLKDTFQNIMLNIIQTIRLTLTLLKNPFFLKNDLNKISIIMINVFLYVFLYYIKKIEKYIFLIYVYVNFSQCLLNNYCINFQISFSPWNSIKFVNQNWNVYNTKFYNFWSYNLFIK